MSRRDTIIARVRALLDKKGKTHSEDEVVVAAVVAAKLMAKYQIAESDLEQADDTIGDNRDVAVRIGKGQRPVRWKWDLAWVVADSARCKPCLLHEKAGQNVVSLLVSFIGRKSDATMCSYLYTYLLAELKSLHGTKLPSIGQRIASYVPGTPVPLVDRSYQRRWSRDFFLAAVSVLHERMTAVTAEVFDTASSTALARLQKATVEVTQFAQDMGISYERDPRVEVRSREGFDAGASAGRSIDLSPEHEALAPGQRGLPPSASDV